MIELALGIILSMTSGLGYSTPSYGASIALDSSRLRFTASVFEVEKNDGGKGNALHTSLAFRAIGTERCGVWIGADAVKQSVQHYDDSEVLPMVEVASRSGRARFGAYYLHGTGHDIQRIVGMNAESRGRVRVRGSVEHVEHTQGSGERYTVSVLARVK